MGILNSTKTTSVQKIKCGESFDLTLGLTASPDIASKPKEIALVLDRSGSMRGEPLKELKNAVKKFLDILDVESDGIRNRIIGADSKVALVSFSTTAKIESALTDSTNKINMRLDDLTATGSTNHADAFAKGLQVLSTPSNREKIMILFTDGDSNQGSEGFAEAEQVKAAGIKLYCIGYGTQSGIKSESLYRWASSPSAAYTLISPNIADIETAFTGLVQNIAKPGASNISVTDTIADCFEVTAVRTSKGTAAKTGKNSVKWDIAELGKAEHEAAVCILTLKHTDRNCKGNIVVNNSAIYTDGDNNKATFISPSVNVTCDDTPVIVEECPIPVDVTIDGCKDSVNIDASNITVSSLGRVLQLDLNLKNICPGKQVSLAVALYEKDINGNEYSRGMKSMLIPAQTGTVCSDIAVKCIRFVLPEALDESGSTDSICNPRNFRALVLVNYADTDFKCCETI